MGIEEGAEFQVSPTPMLVISGGENYGQFIFLGFFFLVLFICIF
jgi:hypothetical protein